MPSPTPKNVSKRWYHLLWRVLRSALTIYLLLVVCMMFLEESLLFFPSRYPEGNWQPYNLTFEDAWFEAADGTRLHGWYAPTEKPLCAILFCHGNGGNITYSADQVSMLTRQVGASVLIFDYRGYGRSEGKPSEQGILADARAARAWLAQKEGIAETDIVLLGESLGGGVAVDLAASDGARALVLESTFSSLPDVAAHHYPWLPVRLLMRSKLDSAGKIASYRGPLLQCHSIADTIVPYRFGQKLFEAANEPKELITWQGGGHNEYLPPAYYAKLKRFLQGDREKGL
jgi:uncharacterized protein